MLKQTIIWTALPNGSDGPLQAGTSISLSALISPRLWSDTPEVREKLSAYPDFLDWPTKIQQATFQVDLGDGQLRAAAPDFSPLRPDLWAALFNANTEVIPFVFQDYSSRPFQNGPVAIIEDILKGVYQDVGTDPLFGQGADLPKAVDLAQNPTLDAIGRPYVPEQPYVPPPEDPIRFPGKPPADGDGTFPGPGEGPDGKPGCCLIGCLALPLVILRGIIRLLGFALTFPFGATVTVPAAQASAATQELVAATKPYVKEPVPMPSAQEIKDTYDFHSMVASAGDYPWLLRALGLVVDLTVTLAAPMPAAASTVKIVPTLAMQMANSSHISMRTHYQLGQESFQAQPRPVDPEISNGLLKVDDSNRFRVIQVDAVGGGIKLTNFASNLRLLGEKNLKPENSPEEAGLPALRSGGLALVKPNQAEIVHGLTLVSFAHNQFVANIDGSPILPSASPKPPPPATDELFAEDLVRGYSIDVFDDQSNLWHSLCQRKGSYDFGGGLVESGIVDEGFVSLGATESPEADPQDTNEPVRLFETLVTWSGWSLAAPRPGKTILSEYTDASQTDYKTAYPTNPAVTNFPMSANFQAVPGSLPRLRFGWKYRLRARVVDLAGNRVFTPDDQVAFQQDLPQKTGEIQYDRFEPIDPPPVVLKETPTLGESLERLVVRSTIHEDANTIHGRQTERHIVPPKTSQLMAEQHGRFDGLNQMLSDQAAYELASREAGTLIEALDLATGDLNLVPGAQVIEEPEIDPDTNQPVLDDEGNPVIAHTFHLQTGADFILTYLPDPFSRGVLLLGLPGMASFDQVIEPTSGQIVNKIPFSGAWPNPKPFRLRLQGLKDGEPLEQPLWKEADHTLTVKLPQGVTTRVRISSYFEEADLRQMGVWHWIEETGVAHLNTLQTLAVQGRNWLHLPWRSLTLVHAVRQPLAIPNIDNLDADKALGATGASLEGQITVDAKSTGKLDLRATWEDPFDDLNKSSFNPATDLVKQDAHVAEMRLPEDSPDAWPVEEVYHEVGDTKYHRVTYQALGTTRYREYFDPPQNEAEVLDMMRPTPAELGSQAAEDAKFPLVIKNSVRPDAPKVLYVLPTFQWGDAVSDQVTSHFRISGGLRIYMERPWYSSGAGELLGILLRPENIDPQAEAAKTLEKYTSQWGRDPVWSAAHVEPLARQHLIEEADWIENRSLEELLPRANAHDQRGVDVVAYEAHYDNSRDLWFAEVIFDPAFVTSYFTFVRLALARFQRFSAGNALNSAHLSRVVRSDYVQLPPERRVDYDTGQLQANNIVTITVGGPAGFKFERVNVVLVQMERRDPRVADPADPLGWQPIGDPLALEADLSKAPELVTWRRTITLPNPPPSPLRLVIRELEVLPADPAPTVRPPDELHRAPTSMVGFANRRARTVFADELILTP